MCGHREVTSSIGSAVKGNLWLLFERHHRPHLKRPLIRSDRSDFSDDNCLLMIYTYMYIETTVCFVLTSSLVLIHGDNPNVHICHYPKYDECYKWT